MLILDEILERIGGLKQLQGTGRVRLGKDGRTLLLEHLGFGPTAEHSIRLVRINQFGMADPEMHLEWRGDIWMPYYYNNGRTGAELFLYGFRSERAPLFLNWEAGTKLIEMAFYLELNLWAEGFREAARDLFQPSLFAAAGGAA